MSVCKQVLTVAQTPSYRSAPLYQVLLHVHPAFVVSAPAMGVGANVVTTTRTIARQHQRDIANSVSVNSVCNDGSEAKAEGLELINI